MFAVAEDSRQGRGSQGRCTWSKMNTPQGGLQPGTPLWYEGGGILLESQEWEGMRVKRGHVPIFGEKNMRVPQEEEAKGEKAMGEKASAGNMKETQPYNH